MKISGFGYHTIKSGPKKKKLINNKLQSSNRLVRFEVPFNSMVHHGRPKAQSRLKQKVITHYTIDDDIKFTSLFFWGGGGGGGGGGQLVLVCQGTRRQRN
jgi:hypothetical protein